MVNRVVRFVVPAAVLCLGVHEVQTAAQDRLTALRNDARAAELHPYDVPEILALPVEAGLAAYLSWVRAETRPEGAA